MRQLDIESIKMAKMLTLKIADMPAIHQFAIITTILSELSHKTNDRGKIILANFCASSIRNDPEQAAEFAMSYSINPIN